LKKSILVLSLALILGISVPLVLGALTYQRDIYTSGTTAAYDWSSRTGTLTAWGAQRANVAISVTANSTRELTGINWGLAVPVININYSRGYCESAHAILTLTNTGNVPVKIDLALVSYNIDIPQTMIRAFWGMSSKVGPNIVIQPGQTVHPSLAIAIVSNTPAHAAAYFNVHIAITATQA
jgi:hypothetical protein